MEARFNAPIFFFFFLHASREKIGKSGGEGTFRSICYIFVIFVRMDGRIQSVWTKELIGIVIIRSYIVR